MTEAKVPDNKSDWKAIDIFLFSNGQRSSPPRKYHLMTDQLDWWKATLNFLAKAQYGSMHSMVDLYTIEGIKIETPMELSHNTAYVAVAPPELFIDASYEKYLIKATRSWEKSQIRRSSTNTALVRPEESQIENDLPDPDRKALESISTKVLRDGSVTLKTIVASMVDNQPSLIVKPEVNSNKQIHNTNNLNPINGVDTQKPLRRKSSGMEQKKLLSTLTTRKPSLKRKDSVKINMEIAKDRPSLDTNNSKICSRSKIYKPIHRDSVVAKTLTKVEEKIEDVKPEKSSSTLKFNNEKSFLTKAFEEENVKEDEDITNLKYYLNNYSQKPSIAVNPDMNLSGDVNRQGGAHELLFNESHAFIDDACEKTENIEESKTANSLIPTNMTNNQALEHESSSPLVSAVSKIDKPQNDVAPNDKQHTVNLKLNIDIWSYANEAKLTTIDKESLLNITDEKGSQVDIKNKPSKHDTSSKTITKDINNDDDNHKVIIVKCTCLSQDSDITKNNMIPVNIGNNNFLMFLPVLKQNENNHRCECKENKETIAINQTSSVEYPVKRTTSCLSLYKGKAEKMVSHSELTSKNNSIEMKVETNMIHDRNEMTTIKRKSVAIKEDQEKFPQLDKPGEADVPGKDEIKMLVHLSEPEKSECNSEIVLKKESIGILHKSANKFTQTEWCDVLLELKLQDDGHYSLHMPPLEMLKNYKL